MTGLEIATKLKLDIYKKAKIILEKEGMSHKFNSV